MTARPVRYSGRLRRQAVRPGLHVVVAGAISGFADFVARPPSHRFNGHGTAVLARGGIGFVGYTAMASSMILETARLWLRPFAREDVDVLHCMWIDADVRRYLFDDKIIEREWALNEVDSSIASFRENGFGMWVVMLTGATEVAGFAGYRLFGDPKTKKELMYGMAPQHWGCGYATEVARELLRFGFETLGEERLWARTDPPNIASMRVMEKAGMSYVGREYEGDLEIVTYVIDKDAFGGARSSQHDRS